MSTSSGIPPDPSCKVAYDEFQRNDSPQKYIIFKITDNKEKVIVDEIGSEEDYEVFRKKLIDAKDGHGKARPSLAVYKLKYVLGPVEGKREKIVFISYINDDVEPRNNKLVYSTTQLGFRRSLGPGIAFGWQANDEGDLELEGLEKEARKGK